MENIDIKKFTTVSSVADGDNVLLVRSGGSHGKIRMSLFLNNVKGRITPEIGSDGIWYIGGTSTGVMAEGKTPQIALQSDGICYRFSDGEDWTLIVPLEELRMEYDSLTEEQRADLKMTFDDLRPEDIAELQKPANDMISVLQQTDNQIKANEEIRQQQEQQRQEDTAAAVADAIDTAEHPTYPGADNYMYVWNKETQTYDKTDVYIRGEGFHISRVYSSIAEMNADSTAGLKEGDFALINTGDVENPDNARLYTLGANMKWSFLVDMSGAIGFTGRTPQLFIGVVTTGVPDTPAAASVVQSGVDEDGHPKYFIHLTIPKGDTFTWDDLTDENIAELQRPANEMIAVLEQTNKTIQEAENIRIAAENERISSEDTRKANEQQRQSSENVRIAAEDSRIASENERQEAELLRKQAETERAEAESLRKTAEQGRVEAENKRVEADNLRTERFETATRNAEEATQNANTVAGNSPKIVDGVWNIYSLEEGGYVATDSHALGKSPYISDHGTWIVYNDVTGEWEDTNKSVNSTYDLSKGKVEAVLTGDITTHTHEHLRYAAQVFEEEPDFTTLTEWADAVGTHPYLPGNDIYVVNSSEPTGYANYRYAVTTTGNQWVRIPQIAAGWKIVLVRE